MSKAAFVKEDNYSRFTALGEVTDDLSASCFQKWQEAPSYLPFQPKLGSVSFIYFVHLAVTHSK